MFRIILVEDEPAAMSYLKSIIEIKCSGFEIVDTAENGVEGLEKIRALKPDVIITDIRMSGMDGIELVSLIKDEFPFIYSVIVSGYQDFEYTRGAIQSQVVDYLLKPINVNQMKALLDSIRGKLEKRYYNIRVELFKQILQGIMPIDWRVNKYLPFDLYKAAIMRVNGLPTRFSSKDNAIWKNRGINIYSILDTVENANLWILPGRDEREMIIVCSQDKGALGNEIERFVAEIGQKITFGYHTAVLVSGGFELGDFKESISSLYRTMDHNIVIGLSQTIYDSPDMGYPAQNWPILNQLLGNKIDFLTSNNLYDELKRELTRLFVLWEKEQRTQLWIESILRQILRHIEKQSCSIQSPQKYDIEFELDKSLCYSKSFGELMDKVWQIIEKILQCEEKRNYKIDTPVFFNSIEKYINQNLCEGLSLKLVCKIFGISQTYLSKLFRKYKGISFNEYLTHRRISEAKRIITKKPDIPLKDVATIVGYTDQFYFSRVFRKVAGIPPSKFQQDSQQKIDTN